MSYSLILVGGTGQRFGVALGYLYNLGLAPAPKHIFVIDAEGHSESKGSVTDQLETLFDASVKVERILPYQRKTAEQVRFKHAVAHYGHPLWPLCFTTEDEELNLTHGFYAKPKIAATTFGRMLSYKDEPGNALGSLFRTKFDQQLVCLVGSVSGGTGAGLLQGLARSLKEHTKQLVGVIFSRYLSLRDIDQAPEDHELESNSWSGLQYMFEHHKALFHQCFFLGPPVGGNFPKAESDRLHPFIGFLNSALLLSDGGFQLQQYLTQNKVGGAAEQSLLSIMAGRSTPWFYGEDILIPNNEKGELSNAIDLNQVYHMLPRVRQAVEEFIRFDFVKAVNSVALFCRQRMGPVVFDTLKESSGGVLSRTTVQTFQNALLKMGEHTIKAIDEFHKWLDALQKNGQIKFQDVTNDTNSSHWSESIGRLNLASQTEPKEFAQEWLRQVCKAQWIGRNLDNKVRARKCESWHLPYEIGVHPEAAEDSLRFWTFRTLSHPPKLSHSGRFEGMHFPTPLGEVFAFEHSLRHQLEHLEDTTDLRKAERLWLWLALGWIKLEVFTNEDYNLDFDRAIIECERDPDRRREIEGFQFGLIYLNTSLQRELNFKKPLGMSYPATGLWSGVGRTDQNVERVIEALDKKFSQEKTYRVRAVSVLKAWLQSLQKDRGVVLDIDEQVTWLQVVTRITNQHKQIPPMKSEHLKTTNPCQLKVWRILDGSQKEDYELLYPFSYDAWRAIRRRILATLIADKTIRFESSGKSGHFLWKGNVVASITTTQYSRKGIIDWDKSFREGFLALDLGETLPLGLAKQSKLSLELADALHLEDDINNWLRTHNGMQRPDLLWED